MLRGALSRSALIVGALALLGGVVLGSRLLSSAPEPAGVGAELLETSAKLRPAAQDPEPDAGRSPYQPEIQPQRASQEEPNEAPGQPPVREDGDSAGRGGSGWGSADWDSGEPDPGAWDEDDWDEEDEDD